MKPAFIFFTLLCMCTFCNTTAAIANTAPANDSARVWDCTVVIQVLTNNSLGLVQNVFNQTKAAFGGYQIEYIEWSNTMFGEKEIRVKLFAVTENALDAINSKLHTLSSVVGVCINKDEVAFSIKK